MGKTIEDGEAIDHKVVMIVTGLTKTIDGVRTVVMWERDYKAGELEENEIALFAQADDGTVWHFGQYPEVYEGDEIVETPAWIHGVQGAQAGVTMLADPVLDGTDHSQGWGPAVAWSDRAKVHALGERTCVKAGCYSDVLVMDEYSQDEPGAHQLKYYAPGVGAVRVGWSGDDPTKETLELVSVRTLTTREMASVHTSVLAAEKRAYRLSRSVYGATAPMTTGR